jgi:hypothetical protein
MCGVDGRTPGLRAELELERKGVGYEREVVDLVATLVDSDLGESTRWRVAEAFDLHNSRIDTTTLNYTFVTSSTHSRDWSEVKVHPVMVEIRPVDIKARTDGLGDSEQRFARSSDPYRRAPEMLSPELGVSRPCWVLRGEPI